MKHLSKPFCVLGKSRSCTCIKIAFFLLVVAMQKEEQGSSAHLLSPTEQRLEARGHFCVGGATSRRVLEGED